MDMNIYKTGVTGLLSCTFILCHTHTINKVLKNIKYYKINGHKITNKWFQILDFKKKYKFTNDNENTICN